MKVGRRLEREAHHLATNHLASAGLQAHLAREIALTLEELQRARNLYRLQRRRLLEDECSVGTDLLRVTQASPRYSPDEATLRARLLTLTAERRRLDAAFEERLGPRHQHLFQLVQRFRLLEPPSER